MIMTLLQSIDPVIRYKTQVQVLGKDPHLPELLQLQEEIRSCPRVQRLLSDRNEDGLIPFHPYSKWQGAHWVLTVLADCGYPPSDETLFPLRDQVYAWLFSEEHLQGIQKRTANRPRVRLHASQEANALFASLTLGLTTLRTEELVDRLLWAQWEDGGWNCDRHDKADTSSFYESITPLRALARFAQMNGDARVQAAVERGSEVFLKRGLFRRFSDGTVIRDEFLKLRLPAYHYYNILWALEVIVEAGFIHDPRCQEALDILESKQLPGGGFPAEGKYYYGVRKPGEATPHGSVVDWGIVARGKSNEFVTAAAYSVLSAAGRLRL